jgi:pilus assembly protein TadC
VLWVDLHLRGAETGLNTGLNTGAISGFDNVANTQVLTTHDYNLYAGIPDFLTTDYNITAGGNGLSASSQSIAVPSLALLLFAPIILLGADYLFDELLKVNQRLGSARHYRAFLYLTVITISLLVILQTLRSNSYFEAFRITGQSLLSILTAILLAFFLGKWIMRQTWSSRERRRIEQLELELPQYLEMFHILITSGMSVLSALRSLILNDSQSQISARQRSEMRDIITEVIAGVEQGLAIERALDEVVLRAGSEQLRRFSDAVILGMERGSSMGQTLRNLITETRNQSKVLVMQRAGKAEIQLLIPVVFLILPISVMFAIWPSYINLSSILGG